jgi:hypothetical protein
MRSRNLIISTATFCGLLASLGGVSLAASGWAEYRNERYGFSIQYPADTFVVERTSEAGDGRVYVALEGNARLLVGALVNNQNYTPASYQDFIAKDSYSQYQISYRRHGSNWFALSGEGDGKIFYEKVMFTCGGRLINSFAMIYPADKRQTFDPMLERIEDSFSPGRGCEHAGLAPPPAKPQATTPARPRYTARHAPSNALPRGERSALADRIARARGHDVIVIMRRTTPPYDRKILHGYVSRP